MGRSVVVTGGGRGIGRAIAEHLSSASDTHVVVLDREAAACRWTGGHLAPGGAPGARRVALRHGEGGDRRVHPDAASFVSGTVLPLDGGRTVLGHDPEAR